MQTLHTPLLTDAESFSGWDKYGYLAVSYLFTLNNCAACALLIADKKCEIVEKIPSYLSLSVIFSFISPIAAVCSYTSPPNRSYENMVIHSYKQPLAVCSLIISSSLTIMNIALVTLKWECF